VRLAIIIFTLGLTLGFTASTFYMNGRLMAVRSACQSNTRSAYLFGCADGKKDQTMRCIEGADKVEDILRQLMQLEESRR
jgi:hypothetical protein